MINSCSSVYFFLLCKSMREGERGGEGGREGGREREEREREREGEREGREGGRGRESWYASVCELECD